MSDDLYKVLGVPREASTEEVRKAYRRKAKKAHPDAGGDAVKFGALQRAHDVLVDPTRRANYDATGEVDEAPAIDFELTQALGRIGHMLMEMLTGEPDPLGHPLVEVMRDHIKKAKANVDSTIVIRKRTLSRAKKMKFTRRTPGPNMIAAGIDWNVRAATKALEGAKQELAILDRAAALLADYDYEQVIEQSVQFYTVGTTSSTGGWR